VHAADDGQKPPEFQRIKQGLLDLSDRWAVPIE
jgi:hypothetical protein